jgi:branched-chain amino acid transport system permease protein
MDLIESYRDELKLVRKPWSKVWMVGMLAAALLMPLYLSSHVIYLVTLIVIFSIGVMGQNLLIGYTGQISFGQAGFLAIGAFTFGHLAGWGIPWPLSLLGGGAAAASFGILIGIPSLRLKGPYLAIVTMGFGVAVYQILVNVPLLSGGRMGMMVAKLEPLFGLSRINYYFYLNLLICLLFLLLTYNIVSSYMGRAFIAIRDNDIAAEVLGVNLTRYKLMAFAISSFYVGIQGGLYALMIGYLEANMFTWMETIGFLVAVIVGGLAMVNGSIMGAAFVILVPHLFSAYKELVPVLFGVAIIIIMIFEPQGLAGRVFKVRLYFRNWPFR